MLSVVDRNRRRLTQRVSRSDAGAQFRRVTVCRAHTCRGDIECFLGSCTWHGTCSVDGRSRRTGDKNVHEPRKQSESARRRRTAPGFDARCGSVRRRGIRLAGRRVGCGGAGAFVDTQQGRSSHPGRSSTVTVTGTPGHYFALVGSTTGAGFSYAGVQFAVGPDVVILAMGNLDGSGRAVVNVVPPFVGSSLDRYYIQAVTSTVAELRAAAGRARQRARERRPRWTGGVGRRRTGGPGGPGRGRRVPPVRRPTGPAGAARARRARQGPAGAAGAAGVAGPAGPVGPQGPAGNDGAAGAAGPQGPAGADGAAGAAGPQGPAGNDGAAGAAGPQGPAGNDGAAGAAGPQGPQGPAGNGGAAGASGSAGNAGNDGAAGCGGPRRVPLVRKGPRATTARPGAAGSGRSAGACRRDGANWSTVRLVQRVRRVLPVTTAGKDRLVRQGRRGRRATTEPPARRAPPVRKVRLVHRGRQVRTVRRARRAPPVRQDRRVRRARRDHRVSRVRRDRKACQAPPTSTPAARGTGCAAPTVVTTPKIVTGTRTGVTTAATTVTLTGVAVFTSATVLPLHGAERDQRQLAGLREPDQRARPSR